MKNIKFEISLNDKRDKKSACITIGGDLSLKGAGVLKNKLLEVRDQYNKVEMNISDVVNIDLAAIQLLLSFKRTFGKENKRLEMNFSLSTELESLVIRSGFEELLSGNKKLADN
jgi:ABC-type transporter Mla MlaB component